MAFVSRLLFGAPAASSGGAGAGGASAPVSKAKREAAEELLQEGNAKIAEQREKQMKTIRHLETQIKSAKAQAMEKLKAGDKSGAAYWAKKMALLQKDRDRANAQLQNLDLVEHRMTSVARDSEYVATMSVAAKALSAQKAVMDPDGVQDMMDQLGEDMAELAETAEVLSAPLAGGVDESETEALLESLMAESAAEAGAAAVPAAAARAPAMAAGGGGAVAADMPVPPVGMPEPPLGMPMPQVPTGPVAVRSMDDELAALEASM